MKQPTAYTLHLTELQAVDLHLLLEHLVNIRENQLGDIGKDHPFSDPIERDEIKGYLQREIDVAEFVMELLPDPDIYMAHVMAMEQSETKTEGGEA
tara:strand:+ start:604 stop:891 length:288 start_codon:yes stop_codon:yes gene_type:complete